ncbi:AraC family transcriptional regulator, partial [Streptomyces sp. NPDC059096]|uniref:AraC family transcriptional regulator n=1 Tax=Streptomyces sp. NPDC059096 TaxID=3346727 RepID=UPI0036AFE850
FSSGPHRIKHQKYLRHLLLCKRDWDGAGPRGRLQTIASIGRRWGFVDATHFSRSFKQAYGLSPRAWRELHHPAPSRRSRALSP